ncbi:rRNA maturation RNase YbeY [Tateyamaria omphalii]|uniref:rRNA maturation RNase YbeY n=1 Tax=Tateyamaria omphalii TaxID=299262 RepID=UPI001C99BF5E|nr:rRNA maturation RNase YbeY [Tateyamaria omphalii]MBY5934246.1 rRNA maturation RNase YbeY [Tateyamaria omphalii]
MPYDIDILIEDHRWHEAGLEALARDVIAATLQDQGIHSASVSLLACDDARIAVLNADFRDKSAPTNVLSWPEEDLSPDLDGDAPRPPHPDPTGEISLGDIAIAYDTCAREAAEQGKPFATHVTHLLVHGTLHLLGYDHIRDLDATRMEQLEVETLGKLGLPNPY